MNLYSNILGEGQAFIFLHGFLGMGDNWKTLGTTFSEEGFEVHLIDQRNHGRSFHSDEFNYEVMVEDLKRYCDQHHLKDIILLGHSMGGKTAMLFAVEYPDMVSKLIIADISPRYYPTHHDAILKGLSALDFETIKNRGEADDELKGYVPDVGTRQFLLKNLYWKEKGVLALRINLDVLKEQVNEVGEPLPMHVKFEKETLFLRGDRSEYISVQDESLIQSHFPKARIVTIANAGHWLHAENPKDFYKEVKGFLGKK
ncbi:alpha/beta fold hydrolase [Gelidibacter salicanalis]|uniref:Alpha/beta fold hydrolase n=1 Tax=Gelidibacter salicanalis TaxID=291193 RepID=A0A934KIY2_9FLAO|nr:alpha/beta fold hydrolase [Gelidibacter salicanalis]MBJ7880356.1 alpha/beta fold hydrolase [Gelidibacter salicanalis]